MPPKCCWVIHGSLTSERKASTSPSSFINHSTLLLNRALKRQAPCLYMHFEVRALDRLRTRRRVGSARRRGNHIDALGLRAPYCARPLLCFVLRFQVYLIAPSCRRSSGSKENYQMCVTIVIEQIVACGQLRAFPRELLFGALCPRLHLT